MPLAFHMVAKSAQHRRMLWRDWGEARVLWDAVMRATPGRIAVVLMPDHLHVVHEQDLRVPLSAALSGYTRWRNGATGETGRLSAPVWIEPVEDDTKLRILVKYVHLNPCRSELVSDPLSWPFSTHRDACGLAVPAAIPRARNVPGFHRFVSSDPFVVVGGTPLPEGRPVRDPFAVLEAVSAVTRTPLPQMTRRGPARRLFLAAAFALAHEAARRSIADLVHVGRDASARAVVSKESVQVVAKVLGDGRFELLHTRPLAWAARRYRR